MKLEEEIKQKKFKDEYQKLFINLIYTGNWAKNLDTDLFKSFNLTAQQYNVLRILRGQYPKPISVNLVADRMLDKMSNASRLVEKLRQKKWVQRKECPSDRRQVEILITDAGLSLLEDIDIEMEKRKGRFQYISKEEAKLVNDILDRLRG